MSLLLPDTIAYDIHLKLVIVGIPDVAIKILFKSTKDIHVLNFCAWYIMQEVQTQI